MRPLLLLLAMPSLLLAADPIRVTTEIDPQTKSHRFVFAGVSAERSKGFDFRVVVFPSDPKDIDSQPELPGQSRIIDGRVVFAPKYPPTPGLKYRVSYRLDPKGGFTHVDLSIPKPKVAPTVVEAVYPTRDKLPENQLKFYLHFSAPMSRGDAYDHIRILDAKGKPIDKAFLELGEELWDRDQKRFTLLFDPGRIKQGLRPREDLGPVLEAGKSYTLVVSKGFPDGNGEPLKSEYRKSFTVGAPDEKQPNHTDWKLTAPTAATDPLKVTFPEPLDHALLHRMLWVVDAEGKEVEGRVEVLEEETQWRFSPAQGWKAGRFKLVVDKRLEDLAGNSIAKPFEVDETSETKKRIEVETVEMPFEVRAK
jgi:hypothetical protein